jgi:hypothetical protein
VTTYIYQVINYLSSMLIYSIVYNSLKITLTIFTHETRLLRIYVVIFTEHRSFDHGVMHRHFDVINFHDGVNV